MMTTTPQQADDAFTLSHWELVEDAPAIDFHFQCDVYGAFVERVTFPSLTGALHGALDRGLANIIDLLHIALGVSYYKCAAAKTLALGTDAPHAMKMAEALYSEGLAEFFVRAGLPFPAELSVLTKAAPSRPLQSNPTLFAQSAETLVAFGGGKDSYVAADMVARAGKSAALCSVTLSQKVQSILQKTAPQELLFIERSLAPQLRGASAQGAFNGHVPITAINSLALVILGKLTGASYVVFANERSADEPTMMVGDMPANHQYSKSGAFEEILREAVKAADAKAPHYFSMLRPYSEIWIARHFASLKTPFSVFTSCNKNFQITGAQSPRWCGDCAKCAFTSLLTAPFLTRQEAEVIFPDLFLNRENLMPLYAELCGLTYAKPWDCVGTINECRAVLYQLGQSEIWQDTLLVTRLLPRILQENTAAELEQFWTDGLAATTKHGVPSLFIRSAENIDAS